MIYEGLDILALRRDSLCVLYRIYHEECSGELFDLLPGTEFCNRTVRKKLQYHPLYIDTWHSTTVRFRRNYLPRAAQLWIGLPAIVLPGQYDLGTFKKRLYLHLKGWQRIYSSSVMGDLL